LRLILVECQQNAFDKCLLVSIDDNRVNAD
jgi:hypothetical protein